MASLLRTLLLLAAAALLLGGCASAPPAEPVPFGAAEKIVSPRDTEAALRAGTAIAIDPAAANILDPAKAFRLGVEAEYENNWRTIRGYRVALVCDKMSLDQRGTHTIEHFRRAIAFTFAHAILLNDGSGPRDAAVDAALADSERIRVFELGPAEYRLNEFMLKDIDLLVWDAALPGPRYAFAATALGAAVEECALRGIPIVVFDRPLLSGNIHVDGPTADRETIGTATAFLPVPAFPAMTPGELAQLYNGAYGIQADLKVVAMKNWKRADGAAWLRTGHGLEPTPDGAKRLDAWRSADLLAPGWLELQSAKDMAADQGWKLLELRRATAGAELVVIPNDVEPPAFYERLTAFPVAGFDTSLTTATLAGAVVPAVRIAVAKPDEARPLALSLAMRLAATPRGKQPAADRTDPGLYGARAVFAALARGVQPDVLRKRWEASEPWVQFIEHRKKALIYPP